MGLGLVTVCALTSSYLRATRALVATILGLGAMTMRRIDPRRPYLFSTYRTLVICCTSWFFDRLSSNGRGAERKVGFRVEGRGHELLSNSHIPPIPGQGSRRT